MNEMIGYRKPLIDDGKRTQQGRRGFFQIEEEGGLTTKLRNG